MAVSWTRPQPEPPPSRSRAAALRPVGPTPAPPPTSAAPGLHDSLTAVLELLDGPLTPPARLTRRQRNRVEHNLDQARLALRRALALMA